MSPLGANVLLLEETEDRQATQQEIRHMATSSTSPAPEDPVVAAATAAASAEAAAQAAAVAKDVAASAVRGKEEDTESSVSSNASSDDSDLLTGVRASRAFKVVPSQIKDLLDTNTHAFRVTPKNGIESKRLVQRPTPQSPFESGCITTLAYTVTRRRLTVAT